MYVQHVILSKHLTETGAPGTLSLSAYRKVSRYD